MMLKYLQQIERSLLVIIFLAMSGLFFFGVIAREVGGNFASQFAWVEEATRLMNIWLVFLSLGLALERGRHVGIDSLHNRLSKKWLKLLRKAIDAIGFIFCINLVWLAYHLAIFVLNSGQKSPTLGIPMGYMYLAPMIGFILLALRFALSFFEKINRFNAKPSSTMEDKE